MALLEDAAQIGQLNYKIDETPSSGGGYVDDGAYYRPDNHTIYFSRGLINRVKNGTYTNDMLLFIAAHEIGHASHRHTMNKDPAYEEEFADFYAILLLEEMQHEGLQVDLYKAISYFLLIPGHGDAAHKPAKVRYQILKEKLDYWKATEGRNPE